MLLDLLLFELTTQDSHLPTPSLEVAEQNSDLVLVFLLQELSE